jgi:Asp-tRNA(Asn)/Glu-tRNA(Gln) amidotransferase C subunit
VRSALDALLELAESLNQLDLEDVEPAFTSLEWP